MVLSQKEKQLYEVVSLIISVLGFHSESVSSLKIKLAGIAIDYTPTFSVFLFLYGSLPDHFRKDFYALLSLFYFHGFYSFMTYF